MLESIIGTEITLIAFAACMAVSLALGLGIAFLCMYKTRYTQSFVVTLAIIPAVVLAVLFFVVMAAFVLALSTLRFGAGNEQERELKITIPENLDYEGLFDDLFETYTRSARLERVKTSNMGTLYELDYRVVLRDAQAPKEFLDQLRCRNGNLNIVCGRVASQEVL